jgi:acyl-homoserine lactone acylase PvdQ
VFDLADDGGSWILSTGQSGHLASDHYGDQVELWQRGRYLPLKGQYRPDGQLVLQPARTR